ncbi:PLP-dependent aminotransferase family protein [Gordonia sp. NB41Y]|uniref:aminotransferase-like domain-containing protein n=1 Tax=Gordonia sp. NB41Y TaxID=875808 RepID=UPI0002BF9107|nr:PLP-dependent aminotransferase family protein [Gordonia sp. NB41Y]EMP14746.1 hypothetical protein ISGA_826 [Gordonia sp. NB41Y]WLP89054.1 PLP-dependent aminotransferase family protein [Gordonia sp. NB41Y]
MRDPGPQLSARELASMLGTWRSHDGTLSIGLATAIAHLVESGELKSGVRLPAQRVLAGELEVARGTVTTAYEILAGGGYVTAEVGRGSTVSPPNKPRLRPLDDPGSGLSSVVADLSTQSLPAGGTFVDVIERMRSNSLRPYLETDGHNAFGLAALRNAVARYLTVGGTPTVPEQILITAGAQQALWLTVFALAETGDTIMVEDPTYRGILAVLAGCGRDLRVDTLPWSDYTLTRRGRHGPAMVYAQSSVHSPTGLVRSEEMLLDLAESANRQGFLVIEDRSTADLIFDPEIQTSGLAGHIAPDKLLTVGTLSKLFWGGLRVGWIRGEPAMIARVADVKQTIDVTTSVLDQVVASEALLGARAIAEERRRSLMDHAAATVGVVRRCRPEWNPLPPEGGSGLWVDIHSDAIDYAMAAQASGIRIAAGPAFSATRGFDTHIRLPIWHPADDLAELLSSPV